MMAFLCVVSCIIDVHLEIIDTVGSFTDFGFDDRPQRGGYPTIGSTIDSIPSQLLFSRVFANQAICCVTIRNLRLIFAVPILGFVFLFRASLRSLPQSRKESDDNHTDRSHGLLSGKIKTFLTA